MVLLLSAVSSKFELPKQGKFNAAEKVNFMVLMGTYPLYVLTGLSIWLTRGAFLAWVLHFLMARDCHAAYFGSHVHGDNQPQRPSRPAGYVHRFRRPPLGPASLSPLVPGAL